jgi:hypothetical protein
MHARCPMRRHHATSDAAKKDASDGGLDGDATTDALTTADAVTADRTIDALADAGIDAAADVGIDAGCDSGQPSVQCLASLPGLGSTGAIAVDEANVYWVALPLADAGNGQLTEGAAQVMRVPRGGGAAVTLHAGQPGPMVSDGVNLYELESNIDAGLSIDRIPVSGGSVTTLAHGVATTCIAVDETSVYWIDEAAKALMTVAKAGGTPTTLATSITTYRANIVVDDASVYWTAGLGDKPITSVMKVSKAGGAPATILNVPPSESYAVDCRMLAIQGDTLFLAAWPQIMTFSATGAGSPGAVDAATQMLAADSTNLFWVTPPYGARIEEMPVDGGLPVTLVPLVLTAVNDFVVARDGTLYWTDFNQVDSFAP